MFISSSFEEHFEGSSIEVGVHHDAMICIGEQSGFYSTPYSTVRTGMNSSVPLGTHLVRTVQFLYCSTVLNNYGCLLEKGRGVGVVNYLCMGSIRRKLGGGDRWGFEEGGRGGGARKGW